MPVREGRWPLLPQKGGGGTIVSELLNRTCILNWHQEFCSDWSMITWRRRALCVFVHGHVFVGKRQLESTLSTWLCLPFESAMCQHCAVDLAHSKILGDVPILGLAWAAPRIGNSALSDWVKKQPNLRILRITIPIDTVCNCE